jgi:hypothetical protein
MKISVPAAGLAFLLALAATSCGRGAGGDESRAAVCGAIAEVAETSFRLANDQLRSPRAFHAATGATLRAIRALDRIAPPEIRDDTRSLAKDFAAHVDAPPAAIRSRAESVLKYYTGSSYSAVGEYAELRCGLVGGFDIGVERARSFCLAYQRFEDAPHRTWLDVEKPEVARAMAASFDDVGRVAPALLDEAVREGRLGLRRIAAGSATDAQHTRARHALYTVYELARSICSIHSLRFPN